MPEAVTLKYHRHFDPKPVEYPREPSLLAGDQRRAVTYVYSEEIILRVNVALATQRPLLVRGPSGTGKSSLARSVAQVLGWRYYETVITSRTQAKDLLWQVDLLNRLHDAQARRRFELDQNRYVTPGPLWWAFDEASAKAQRFRGARGSSIAIDPNLGSEHSRAVVLLDEIDKADPDTPNNLLVPLGSLQFQVEETRQLVETTPDKAPLIIITTNDERELPLAFLRRCIELPLEYPTRERLVEIGRAQLPSLNEGLLLAVAQALLPGKDQQPGISAAEYVDALRACVSLKLAPDGDAFKQLLSSTIWKHGRKEPRK
ncbi:MoxR family ATPase [Pyxidicoccus parkwayensis]|uniref:MoxR family ATPase n=1 Tax=Pyxidicoccus parkwayensis TaxID=2813578 RepID=A0ABX7P1X2_9BACT|nr:MoxR family ATPase [Pyxidicoccus parkwaysis]QSQ24124.1 MoxR family ATPase [Pyxidicoccus parkwaysis]